MRKLLKNLVVTHGTLLVTAVVSILCVVVSAGVALTDMWVFNHEVFPALYLSVLTPALIAPPVTFVLIRLVEQLDTAERLALEREQLISEELDVRKEIEEHLRQFQKIEAVGQLTGGIAHEFNNILTVVISNLDILDKGDLNESDASTLMQHSTDAAHRGAKLTRQLLAFSRREMLRPETLQTNDLILDEVDFLSPTLGEEITIEAYCAEDLELIEVDRQLLGNAILNLALNARTAMPEGGTLTLETASIDLEEALFDGDGGLPSGRYVTLTVTDTGYGMSPDVLEHAFEPFFTTQGLAEGSGLGLSMVYGFVKQSGGHVAIESEESKGTTVRLFFPVAQGMAEEKEAETVVSR